MSNTRLGRGLLDILRQLGAPIDRHMEQVVAAEKERDPDATTEDIVMRLSLAPPAMVHQAVVLAQEEGSVEALEDRFARATALARDTRQASLRLNLVAGAIAAKKA